MATSKTKFVYQGLDVATVPEGGVPLLSTDKPVQGDHAHPVVAMAVRFLRAGCPAVQLEIHATEYGAAQRNLNGLEDRLRFLARTKREGREVFGMEVKWPRERDVTGERGDPLVTITLSFLPL